MSMGITPMLQDFAILPEGYGMKPCGIRDFASTSMVKGRLPHKAAYPFGARKVFVNAMLRRWPSPFEIGCPRPTQKVKCDGILPIRVR